LCDIRWAGALPAHNGERGERQKPGDDRRGLDSRKQQPSTPKLADLDVSKTQSSRWQKLAAQLNRTSVNSSFYRG
jgi:hypothetical protein